jgi:hypothetical protein
VVAKRALRGERGFAQERFGFRDFSDAEEQNAQVGRGFGVPRIEFESASEGALGERELDDGPIVPELAGFSCGDGVTQRLGGFVEATLSKELTSRRDSGLEAAWLRAITRISTCCRASAGPESWSED